MIVPGVPSTRREKWLVKFRISQQRMETCIGEEQGLVGVHSFSRKMSDIRG